MVASLKDGRWSAEPRRGHCRAPRMHVNGGAREDVMQIKMNGEIRNVEASPNLLEFLHTLKIPSLERGVAVCLNGEVVRKSEWPETQIKAHDELEIVNATQGG